MKYSWSHFELRHQVVGVRPLLRELCQRTTFEMPDSHQRIHPRGPSHRSRRPHPFSPGNGVPDPVDQSSRCPQCLVLGQLAGICFPGLAALGRQPESRLGLDRLWQAPAERHDRKPQRQVSRRVSIVGVISPPGRCQGRDRTMAQALN